jgi:DNA ligase (NAD+)
MGKKSADKVIAAIAGSRDRPLWRLLHGLGIPHVGEGAARKLAAHFRSLTALRAATPDQLETVSDVGAIMAEAIHHYFLHPRNIAVLDELATIGVRTEDEPAPEEIVTGHPLSGKTVVVTGTLTGYSRDEIKEKLRALGAVVTDSVSKKTDVLIAGESAGSKLEKARKLNIRIVEDSELEDVLKPK